MLFRLFAAPALLIWLLSQAIPARAADKAADKDLGVPAAMQAVLDLSYEPERHCGSWMLGQADLGYVSRLLGRAPETLPNSWEVCPHELLSFTAGGHDKAYLILQAKPAGEAYDCHMCASLIGAALFERGPAGWQLRHQSRLLMPSPMGFGQPPEASLIGLGGGRMAVRLEGGYSAQGITIGTQSLLAELDGRLVKVWEGVAYGDNAGTAGSSPHYLFSSKLIFVPRPGQAWPDLHQLVSGTGLRHDGGSTRLADVSETRVFKFKGRQYQPVKTYVSLGD